MTKEILEKLGCTEVKESRGVFEFRKGGFLFKLFHHTTDCGTAVDYWTIGKKRFDDIEELRYYISAM